MTSEEAKRIVAEAKDITPAEIKKLQSERLENLVNYAREHSPYFKELYKDLKEQVTLEDLPITYKKDLMQDYNRWPTDPEVTQEKVFEYLAQYNDNPNAKLLGKYTALATSGTSGVRTPVVRDAMHNEIHNQMVQQRLYKDIAKDPRVKDIRKYASVVYCDPNSSAYASYLRAKRQIGATDDVMRAFSILDPLDKLAQELTAFQPDSITGYPSILADLASMQLEGQMDIRPIMVACSAETTTERHHKLMREAFGDDCHIINNFCSTEGGEIAMSCHEGHLHVNEDWIILEPVDENLQPVPPGVQSAGMLITDLSNFVQPIIRYHVDDYIVWHDEPCPCGNPRPYIVAKGRKGGVNFSFGGEPINTFLLDVQIIPYDSLVNYQFVKLSETECQIRIATIPSDKHDEVGNALLASVAQIFHHHYGDKVRVTLAPDAPIHNKRGGKMLHFIEKEQ